MVHTVTDTVSFHALRNALLISLSLALLPFSLILCTIALVSQRLTQRHERAASRPVEQSRVLVTGVGMMKGLFIARTMHRGGCTVIAGDFDKHLNLHCGRFSSSVSRFYTLADPAKVGSQAYIDQVVSIIQAERIELWISCSGVATAIEDAELAGAIQSQTDCAVFQLSKKAVSILDDKLQFMEQTSKLGLANMTWFKITSPQDVEGVIRNVQASDDNTSLQYMVKSASMDDASRGALPLLSTADTEKMSRVLHGLDFSKGRQWILQEFVSSGEEYCTHALVVRGKVVAFTACRSASVLMHYKQLNPKSILFDRMLQFTNQYVSSLERDVGQLTGHISFDFLIKYHKTAAGFEGIPVPIECNPRCHTATVLFMGRERELANCYLSTIKSNGLVSPSKVLLNVDSSNGYYWIAHDLVALIVMPILGILYHPDWNDFKVCIVEILNGIEHLLTWSDPTFEWRDPLPWLVLNHIYWPLELAAAIIHGSRWKQLNVSTTKIFKY